MRVLCFIPAYNEYSNLKSLISKIKKENYMIDEFLFIDSGSNDGSLDIIKKSGHKYISLNENKGLGYLFIKAIDYSIQHNFDIFVVLSGNDKMNPADFQNILNPILFDGYDFIWGSRFLESGKAINTPKFRETSIPLLSKLVSFLFSRDVTDATNGFRAFKITTLLNILKKYDRRWLYGYSFETYLFGLVLSTKTIISKEVPVEIKYKIDEKHTKIKPFLDYPSIIAPFFIAKIVSLLNKN